MGTIAISFTSILKLQINLTDEQFFELCQNNRDYRFERTAKELLILTPRGSDTGNHNFDIAVELGIWNKQTKLGKGFDSSTGFKLPNGKECSPDVSWVAQARWDALKPEQKQKFAPICPDFVIELRSPSDRLKPLQERMKEYIANGARLGWLIDRKNKRVEIYRPNQEVEILENSATLSGEDVLPGFILDLTAII